jgi:hypothetical protein
MSGPQSGPGWWQGADGHWYPPQSYPPPRAPGASGGPAGNEPEKGARARAFREWIQTGQGIAALIVSIIALGGAGTGAVIASNHNTPTQSKPAPAVSVTTPSQSPAPTVTNSTTVTPALLAQALLPAQTLGTTATVNTTGTDLSQVTGICGAPLPNGAQVAAFETVQDSQTSQDLQEIIVDWGTPAEAGTGISDDRAAVDQTGSCNVTRSGTTFEYTGDYAGSSPRECGAGQFFETQVLIGLTIGDQAETQCGSFTIAVLILGGPGAGGTLEEASGYLNTAVGILRRTT